VSEPSTRSRRAGLGAAALIVSIVPAVWSLVLLAVVGTSSGTEEFEGSFIGASIVVLPVLALVAVVLAVAALIINNAVGRILAITGLVVLIAQGVFFAAVLASGTS